MAMRRRPRRRRAAQSDRARPRLLRPSPSALAGHSRRSTSAHSSKYIGVSWNNLKRPETAETVVVQANVHRKRSLDYTFRIFSARSTIVLQFAGVSDVSDTRDRFRRLHHGRRGGRGRRRGAGGVREVAAGLRRGAAEAGGRALLSVELGALAERDLELKAWVRDEYRSWGDFFKEHGDAILKGIVDELSGGLDDAQHDVAQPRPKLQPRLGVVKKNKPAAVRQRRWIASQLAAYGDGIN
ncbi:hypothetical protein M885DRAFT_241128 [Pelagophyceae sp. CCMP2097]|nr:hypothetical protein M885DRAFT_241128 [Pelagophyceae sp. CCMP2097]